MFLLDKAVLLWIYMLNRASDDIKAPRTIKLILVTSCLTRGSRLDRLLVTCELSESFPGISRLILSLPLHVLVKHGDRG